MRHHGHAVTRPCRQASGRQAPSPHGRASGDKSCEVRRKLPPPAEKSSLSRRAKYIQKFCLYIQNFCLYKQKFCFNIQKFSPRQGSFLGERGKFMPIVTGFVRRHCRLDADGSTANLRDIRAGCVRPGTRPPNPPCRTVTGSVRRGGGEKNCGMMARVPDLFVLLHPSNESGV